LEFSDKGSNVKGLKKLLKSCEIPFNDKTNGKRPTSHGDFWCNASFYKVQYEHIKRDMKWAVYMFCFKFPGVCFYRKLAKSSEIRQKTSQQ